MSVGRHLVNAWTSSTVEKFGSFFFLETLLTKYDFTVGLHKATRQHCLRIIMCQMQSGTSLIIPFLRWFVHKTQTTLSSNQMFKLKPSASWSLTFSRASNILLSFTRPLWLIWFWFHYTSSKSPLGKKVNEPIVIQDFDVIFDSNLQTSCQVSLRFFFVTTIPYKEHFSVNYSENKTLN